MEWAEELGAEYDWDCHMGGHGDWVQEGRPDVRSLSDSWPNPDLKLLLQLNPTPDFWMNNFGMVYLFYNAADPTDTYFGMDFW